MSCGLERGRHAYDDPEIGLAGPRFLLDFQGFFIRAEFELGTRTENTPLSKWEIQTIGKVEPRRSAQHAVVPKP